MLNHSSSSARGPEKPKCYVMEGYDAEDLHQQIREEIGADSERI